MRRRDGRSGWKQVASIAVVLAWLVAFLAATLPAGAATKPQIEEAIEDGLEWLVSQQAAEGYWPGEYDTAETCLALVKLQERAYELGFKSPFAPGYEYSANVDKAWDWVFEQAGSPADGENVHSVDLSLQDHTAGASGTVDDPDTNANGYGVYFEYHGDLRHSVYTTGVCLMALAASGKPNRANDGGLDFDGTGGPDTFKEIAQDAVDWLAWAQADSGVYEGGWDYDVMDNDGSRADNSFTGYATLGLAYGEEFGCTVPAWVKTELAAWVNYIQCGTAGPYFGGSGYAEPCSWVNILKTGNLVFEMTYLGIDASDTRFKNALAYIEDHWQDASTDPGWGYSLTYPDAQAMYCLMKGFEFSRIELIDTDGDGKSDDDWFNQRPAANPPQDFASALVEAQEDKGCWTDCAWGDDTVCTTWALLTLERVAPESPLPPEPEPPPKPEPSAPPPFVPEASTLLLLGSAASGLAGYVGLQIRARRKK